MAPYIFNTILDSEIIVIPIPNMNTMFWHIQLVFYDFNLQKSVFVILSTVFILSLLEEISLSVSEKSILLFYFIYKDSLLSIHSFVFAFEVTKTSSDVYPKWTYWEILDHHKDCLYVLICFFAFVYLKILDIFVYKRSWLVFEAFSL